MKRHIVNINGGLGNQMFQYAFGLKLAQMTCCEVLYDINWYEKIKQEKNSNQKHILNGGLAFREYELEKIFNIGANYATLEDVESTKYAKSKYRGFIRKLFDIPKYQTNILTEANPLEYDEKLFDLKKLKKASYYFEGYFQNEKYFIGIEDKIKQKFQFPKVEDEYNLEIIKKINSCSNPVFIHIRRGDYLNLGWELDIEYYKKAIDYVARNIDNPVFFIFGSDCEDYIKENFQLEYMFEIIGDYNSKNNEDWKDMYLMSQCKHAIIANSTFSWWAAWLRKDSSGVILAPDPFVENSSTIIPLGWRKIKWKKN